MKCGLLGRKLSHSYSPAIHAAFGAAYEYELFEREPDELADFLKHGDFQGLNVTIPYKQAVMEFCAEISDTAREIGSVNTIVRRPGGLFGDNTDAAGFEKMLERLEVPVEGKKVVVFGSHGSSLSICHVLKKQNAGEIVVVAIEDNHAEFLSRHSDAAIVVNCTPAGMYPNVGAGEPPVSIAHFPRLAAVLDIGYNPARTWLLMDAEERGVPHIGGLTMLVGQAARSSEIFTGIKIPPAKESAVVKNLSRRMENIVLIGMPGSGKSTYGKLIAENLNRTFIDADAEIEAAAGQSIPEIFAEHGEDYFRELESKILAQFGKESGLVIATGGGCVTREENYRHLHQNGTIIFTERDVDELPREGRPLSQGDLQAMYEKRLPLYRRFADVTVDANKNPQAVAEDILAWVC